MAISPVSSLTTIATGGPTSSTASSAQQAQSLAMNFNTYLKILTVQLKNQDPTNATDPNQFTQQLIQMQQVQAQITNNEAIKALSKTIGANSLATGVSYIGNYVRAMTDDGHFSLQDGSAQIGYTLGQPATKTTITVKDSSGTTVASLLGGTSAGDNYVTWDGRKSDGTMAENGAYTFMIRAINSAGNDIDVANPAALYKITSLSSNNDGTLTLVAGKLSMLSTDVNGVYSPTTRPDAIAGTLIGANF